MDKEEQIIQYLIKNKDVTMSEGKFGAQTAHAATISTLLYQNEEDFRHWIKNGQTKIVLKASQKELEKLEQEGYIAIRDNGHTEIPPNTLTVVILKPMKRKEAKKIVKRFQLL